jgi:pimeloyl-ACP methyl ester carboxylesterase
LTTEQRIHSYGDPPSHRAWHRDRMAARAASASAGRANAADLSRRHRDDGIAAVSTPDLRHAGETAEIAFGDTGTFAQDVIGILDQLEIGAVDLVGHSLGGLVACGVAAERHADVRKLVLEDIGFPHPRPRGLPERPAGDLPFDWRVVEQVRPEIDDPDPGWADIVARITAPTLLIGGGAASPVPQKHVAELADRLADARLTTIEAGHLVHDTIPDEYLRTLITFLTE